MRSPTALLLAAIVMLAAVALRVALGGPPGLRTALGAALGVVLLLAWLVARRRVRVAEATATPPLAP